MKKLLLLIALTFITTKALCSEQLLSQTPHINLIEEDFFTKLANPTSSNFKAIKALCKEQPDFVKGTRDFSGNNAFYGLFFGAHSQQKTSAINHPVDWYFSLATLYELLLCGLNPAETYVWGNLTTLQTELRPSFFELLDEYKDEPGVVFIAEKTKEFSDLLAQEKEEGEKYAAMAQYWTNNWGHKRKFRSSRK